MKLRMNVMRRGDHACRPKHHPQPEARLKHDWDFKHAETTLVQTPLSQTPDIILLTSSLSRGPVLIVVGIKKEKEKNSQKGKKRREKKGFLEIY